MNLIGLCEPNPGNRDLKIRVILKEVSPKFEEFKKVASKDSEWYVKRLCNLVTLVREYQVT
jgi:hypothetical protein